MRVLLAALNSPGFYHPLIGLGSALQAGGDEVDIAGHEHQQLYFKRHGLNAISLPQGGSGFAIHKWAQAEFSELQYQDMCFAIEQLKPDVVITHPMALGSVLAARQSGTPYVTLGQFSPLWQSRQWQPAQLADSISEFRASRAQEYLEFYRLLCQKVGIVDEVDDEKSLFGQVHLIRNHSAILTETLPEHMALVGDMLWEPKPHLAVQQWLQAMQNEERKIIYVQHGKRFHMDSFWEQLQGQVGQSDYAFALSYGQIKVNDTPWPKNVLALPYIPQNYVLEQAHGAVLHGHTTGILGAIKYAVPSVIIPSGGETLENALLYQGESGVRVLDTDDEINLTSLLAGFEQKSQANIMDHAQSFETACRIIRNTIKPNQLMVN
jgi:UDP:flavonoid glycosyltransferase YjiC (YdhE family)